jgi:hypothetical protein
MIPSLAFQWNDGGRQFSMYDRRSELYAWVYLERS